MKTSAKIKKIIDKKFPIADADYDYEGQEKAERKDLDELVQEIVNLVNDRLEKDGYAVRIT